MTERVNGAVCLCRLGWIIGAASCQSHWKILIAFVSVHNYVLHMLCQKSNASVHIKDFRMHNIIYFIKLRRIRISEVVTSPALTYTH